MRLLSFFLPGTSWCPLCDLRLNLCHLRWAQGSECRKARVRTKPYRHFGTKLLDQQWLGRMCTLVYSVRFKIQAEPDSEVCCHDDDNMLLIFRPCIRSTATTLGPTTEIREHNSFHSITETASRCNIRLRRRTGLSRELFWKTRRVGAQSISVISILSYSYASGHLKASTGRKRPPPANRETAGTFSLGPPRRPLAITSQTGEERLSTHETQCRVRKTEPTPDAATLAASSPCWRTR